MTKTKTIKVSYAYRETRKGSRLVPKLRLEGDWLERLGFRVGDTARVEHEEGMIRILADDGEETRTGQD